MSLENVKTRVLEEAGAKAERILEDATAAARRLLDDGKAADDRAGQDAARDARLRLERESVREIERIQHDNRLQILSAKNKAIDEVFARVNEKLATLSDADSLDLLGKWLSALPVDAGGVLRVNPKDEAKFVSGLDRLNSGRSGAGRFTGVVADPKVASGAIVDGPDYAVDCTMARRLAELRESSAGDLARTLFGA
jgi:vacuolar-type H+-ATPase subunit E/Vma4